MRREILLLIAIAALTVGPLPIGMSSALGNPPTPESAWTIETVSLHGGSADPHIALDSSNAPHVLFCPPGEVRYADRQQTGWTSELVVSTVFGGVCGELVFGPDDTPHATTPLAVGTLKELYGTRASGAWNLSAYPGGLLEAVNEIGEPQVVSYWNLGPGQFSFRYLSLVGGAWVQEDVETFPAPGINLAWASLALDPADTPNILYYDDARGDVRYAFRDSSGWHVEVVEHVGSIEFVGMHGSLAVAKDGTVHATYLAEESFAANRASLRYGTRVVGSWRLETVDGPPGMKGLFPTVLLSPKGLPRIGFQNWGPSGADLDLRYGAFDGASWSFETVYDAPLLGVQFPSFAIDRCDNPHAAFFSNDDRGVMYATKGQPCDPGADQPVEQKREAIQRIKALKETGIDRIDWRFVERLDDAERSVWKSLGYADPFRPRSIDTNTAADTTMAGNRRDRVDLVLGPSWTPRLTGYDAIRMTWHNGDVTTVDLPNGWPRRPLRYHDDAWVDAWEQDLSISSNRDWRTGRVTLTVRARDTSLGFTLSLDAHPVATLSFTYDVRTWWIDGSHLDPRQGHKVFELERRAVECLVTSGARNGGDDDDDDKDGDRDGGVGVLHGDDDREERGGCRHRDRDDDDDHDEGDEDDRRSPDARTPRCRLTPRLWTDAERAELDAECAAIADLLATADEGLARPALEDARATAAKDPRNQGRVDREIGRAERALARAKEAGDRNEFSDAIRQFEEAWEHAQRAIRYANR